MGAANAQSLAIAEEEAPLVLLPDKIAEGWAPVLDAVQLATTEMIDRPSGGSVDPGPNIQESGAGFEGPT